MPAISSTFPRTLFDKIWDAHIITRSGDDCLLYVDKHILHEGSTPLAFSALRYSDRRVRHPETMMGVIDHTIATRDRDLVPPDPQVKAMMEAFHRDTSEYGITIFDEADHRQGIVHVVGPEQGYSLPGSVIVCGDSHTSTNGAFGAFAFGIGTSEVEHVFATRTLWRRKPANMLVRVEGRLPDGVGPKDLALAVIGRVGIAGGTGHVIEFAGSTIRPLSMEGRMTLCNMAIEAGARAGLIAPDEATFEYLRGRPLAPEGSDWDLALANWRTLPSDEGATYNRIVEIDAHSLRPMVTWGTTPQDSVAVDGVVPDPTQEPDAARRSAIERALEYMGLEAGMAIADIRVDHVFIGSCTNGRLEDLRAAASLVQGRHVAEGVTAIVVPGSGLVKAEAEAEGLAEIFRKAGFEWRSPGCSLCLAMNGDILRPGERCASTSNRNFEGRQGRDARTHLVSPATAAAAALTGRLAYPLAEQEGAR
jgi:3-isopropylmalate/(R)-2-methylmalate dehydratase large subunit